MESLDFRGQVINEGQALFQDKEFVEDTNLRLVSYSDFLREEQSLLNVEDIKEEAKQKANLIIDEILQCSHPVFLADFLNNRIRRADESSSIEVKYKNLILDLDGEGDPRKAIILNYARILQILRSVNFKSPEGSGYDLERDVLSIEIPE